MLTNTTLGLLAALMALGAAGNAAPAPHLPFEDVSQTHMPQPVVVAQSKDARPVDIDGDGDLDIVIAHEYRPNIVLVNDGSGRFSNESVRRLPQLHRDSEDVASADFDLDGDPDLLFVSEDDEENELYLNDGRGFFSRANLPTRGVTNAIAVADINGDGAADLVFGNARQNILLLGDGAGGFEDATTSRIAALMDNTQDLEFGDVDGDGDLDLLAGNEDRNRLLINQDGVFVDESITRLDFRETGEETREADFADVDNDGDLDIYFANVNFRRRGSSQNRLLINDGSGVFTDETQARLPTNADFTMDADFVDIDGDGDQDIVTAGLKLDKGLAPVPYRVFENDGTGHFEENTAAFFPASAFAVGTDIEAADFNGDGVLDFFLTNRAGPDLLLFGKPAR